MPRSKLLRSELCAIMLVLVGSDPALAASPFPNKPVRIIVPSAPGGALDLTT